MEFGFFATVAFELLSWGNSILSNVINLIAFNNVLFCSQNTAQTHEMHLILLFHRRSNETQALPHIYSALFELYFINGLHSSYVNRACLKKKKNKKKISCLSIY